MLREKARPTRKVPDLKNSLRVLAAALTLIALISAVWLDRLNFRHQEVSYLPWPGATTAGETTASGAPPQAAISLSEFLHQQLTQFGLPPEAITEEKTDEGLTYVSARTTASVSRPSAPDSSVRPS